VPLFVHALLGTERCRDLVTHIDEPTVTKKMLIWFALELEHRRQAISTEAELEPALLRICVPGFDMAPTAELEQLRFSAGQALPGTLTRASQGNCLLQTIQMSRCELEAKQLPAGRFANLAIMRASLTGRANPSEEAFESSKSPSTAKAWRRQTTIRRTNEGAPAWPRRASATTCQNLASTRWRCSMSTAATH